MAMLNELKADHKPALVICLVLVAVWLAACGGSQKAGKLAHATETLPATLGPQGWVRQGDVQKFVGDSLFQYIDGAAEMYHKYGFIEVGVAEYRKGENAITVDLYRFADSDRAFGMYTTLRPDEPDTVMLGVEAFTLGTNIVFVKGQYLANVYTYDESEEMTSAVRSVAAHVAKRVPGSTDKPAMYDLFPPDGRLPFTEKLYAEAFLGQAFLTDVYTVGYLRRGSTFTLFLAEDPSGSKLEQWKNAVEMEYDPDMGYQHLPYDKSNYLLTTDPYRGSILAGVQQGKIVGIVGHRPEDLDILVAWLASLLGD
jgi:hypothetical protein